MIRLRPSAAHIWTKCAGYAQLMARLPAASHIQTDPAREGTCAAWVAESVMRGAFPNCAAMLDMTHENGWVVDEDMVRFCQDYVDHLTSSYGSNVLVEQTVGLTDNIVGTPDAFAVVTDNEGQCEIFIDDLKYGYEIVEPWENPQIMIYAGGVARSVGLPVKRVRLGIYQPRAYHPLGTYRTWEPSIEELSERLATIIEAGAAASDPNAMCRAGPQCRRCDAAHTCAAVTHELYRCEATMRNDQQRNMTAEEMANELHFLETAERLLKGRRDAVHAEAQARMSKGELIPGWTSERGKGRRQWTESATMVHLMTGIDPTADKMVTPAELERRGANKEIVEMLTKTPLTAPRIKRFDGRIVGGKFQ